MQFAISLRDPNNTDVSGSNGFESDNDANGNAYSSNTNAIFSNVSLFGPKENTSIVPNTNFKRGAHLRRNTKESIYISLIADFPYGLYVDGGSTETNVANDELQFTNNVIAGCDTAIKQVGGNGGD